MKKKNVNQRLKSLMKKKAAIKTKKKNNIEGEEIIKNPKENNENEINLIYEKIKGINKVYNVSKFIRSYKIFKDFFNNKDKLITIEEIVNFTFDILTKEIKENEIFIKNEKIKKTLEIEDNLDNDEKFFYKNSPILEDYMVILYS